MTKIHPKLVTHVTNNVSYSLINVQSYQESFEFQTTGIPIGNDVAHLTCRDEQTYVSRASIERHFSLGKNATNEIPRITDDSGEDKNANQITGDGENVSAR